MPETNSSSCHSITIFGSPDAKKTDLPKHWFKTTNTSDDTLVIPGGESFDRGKRDITDVEGKIQYACTGIWWGYSGELKNDKRKNMLEKVLKDYLGVDFIEYAWDDLEKIETWSEEHPDELIENCPYLIYGESPNELDHESSEVHNEIYESESSLRDFLFSSLSVAACGEYDVTAPEDLYPAWKSVDKGIVLRYSTKINIFLSEKGGFDSINGFDILIHPGFPYLFKLRSLKDENIVWRGIQSKGWYHYSQKLNNYLLYSYSELPELISPESINLLDSIKIITEEKNYIKVDGRINSRSLEQWIPILLPETFKYPFPLFFFPSSITQDEKLLKTLQPECTSPLNSAIATEWLKTYFGKSPIKLIPEIIYNGQTSEIPDKV